MYLILSQNFDYLISKFCLVSRFGLSVTQILPLINEMRPYLVRRISPCYWLSGHFLSDRQNDICSVYRCDAILNLIQCGLFQIVEVKSK